MRKGTAIERAPSIVNTSVTRTRRYLTGREVEKLIEVARKHGRYGPALDAGAQVGHRGRHWEFHLDHIKRGRRDRALSDATELERSSWEKFRGTTSRAR